MVETILICLLIVFAIPAILIVGIVIYQWWITRHLT
jgi:hypothetical protein